MKSKLVTKERIEEDGQAKTKAKNGVPLGSVHKHKGKHRRQ